MRASEDFLVSLHHHFASRLREARERQGLSKLAVAERAGLSQQMVSYVERGIRNPSLDTLTRICGALSLDLPTLLLQAWESKSAQSAKRERSHEGQIKQFGANVRHLRKHKGLQLDGLAEVLGTRPGILQEIETGARGEEIQFLLRLRDALGCSWEELLPRDGKR